MNKILKSLLILSLSLHITPLKGEEEIVHSVNFPEGNAAWSVAFENTAANTTKSPAGSTPAIREIKKLDAVRTGNLRRDTVFWNKGGNTEYWILTTPSLAIFETEPNGPIRSMKGSYLGFRQLDNSTFSWVSKGTYKGMKPFKGEKCRFYETQIEIAEGENQTVYAWINDATLKPMAWSNGQLTATFSFDLPLPKEPLVLPARFTAELERALAFEAPPKKVGKQRTLR